MAWGLVLLSVAVAACSSAESDGIDLAQQPAGRAAAPLSDDVEPGRILVHADEVVGAFDRRILGTNVPAWMLPELVSDQGFIDATVASGTTLLRLPGGSWSNNYDWLACELDDEGGCEATWAMRPSDFLGLLEATGLPAMWTVSINGTAEEAAALVAFFNGEVDDDRPIGTDRDGRDWQTVGSWARLRAERGFPDPMPIRYWEIGNEVFGAMQSAGSECASWGWEDVWTCDGTEYVEGIEGHDGYDRFQEAMSEVDSSIEVGAVGVGDRGEWGDWDDEVMAAAGDGIDFYVVHHYGSDGDVGADDVVDIPRDAWPRITRDVREAFADHGIADDVPIAVTEHNLVAFIDGDDERLMTSAVNAFYLAETIGQLAVNGVEIAGQWNLANGRAANGSDYGLIDGETHQRSPAYYAMVLWSRFGDDLVAVERGDGLDELRVYGGRGEDGSPRLLVVNPSADPIDATISVDSSAEVRSATADVVVAESSSSTEVTFNGSRSPSVELTEPGSVLAVDGGDVDYVAPPYSITLLRFAG